MNKIEALNLIINALEHAQSRGAYGLQDAVNIATAINVIKNEIDPEKKDEATQEATAQEETGKKK